MNGVKFRTKEVIAFLEEKILMNMATEDEMEIYETYVWNRKLNKKTYTYKKILKEMNELLNESF